MEPNEIDKLLSEALQVQALEEQSGWHHPNPAFFRLCTEVDYGTLLKRARYLADGDADKRVLYARLLADASEMPSEDRAALAMEHIENEADPKVLARYVVGLRNAASAVALPRLRELARHPSPHVRFTVPDALSACTERFDQIANLLLELSRDDDREVRWSAIFEVGAWWGETSGDYLEARLADAASNDPSEEVRKAAADALAQHG